MTFSDPHKVLLVVEDDAHMMLLLKAALTNEGFSVIEARSAEQALTHAVSDRPHLLLLDLMLPGLDGMSFLANLRKESWGKHLPVIILTNLSPDDKTVTGITRDEPAYYLIKAHTSMDEIVAKIKEVLGIETGSAA